MFQWLFFEQADHMQSFAAARFIRSFTDRATSSPSGSSA